MTVITMSRTDMSITQYNNVTQILLNTENNIYTILYNGGGSTVSFPKASKSVHIMES